MSNVFKRVLKVLGAGLVGLVLLGIGLYFMGLRILPYGGGAPHLRFQKSLDEQAGEIARHREAQRAQPPAPAAAAAPAPDAPRDPAPAAAAPPRAPVTAPYWTDFRGPRRDGHYRERPIRTSWPSGKLEPLWKQPVGGGHASFVIANGRAFTIEQRGQQEVVAAYDVPSGRELWTNGWAALFSETYGGIGPRATPTWHAGRVYSLGAAGELRALDDATGRLLWRANILDDAGAPNIQWGMSASPLIAGEHVIVVPGGTAGTSVTAYDRATGRRAWTAHDDGAAYSSPMLGRYGYGQVMLAGGHLIVLTEDGELALVRTSPERHIEIARFPVLEGRTWNHPAMADGYLLIRNIYEMAAFDLRRH